MPTRPRLTPAMADVRRAVRTALDAAFPGLRDRVRRDPACGVPGGWVMPDDAPRVVVALSGGPDSLALAVALGFEQGKCGVRAGAVIVDHGLQADSAEVAERAAQQARAAGLAPVVVRRVDVGARPPREGAARQTTKRSRSEMSAGPEADARAARYAALADVATETGASAVLLAHTLDDQAETVLLGLARGSGARSLAGMRPLSGFPVGAVEDPGAVVVRPEGDGFEGSSSAHPAIRVIRPLLGLRREVVHASLADQGIEAWHDPHNDDERFARVRVRHHVLPVLEAELGPGIAEALARTAHQLTDDADVLDALAAEALGRCLNTDGSLDITQALSHPSAVRSRFVRRWLTDVGGREMGHDHVSQILLLMVGDVSGEVQVPGVTVTRHKMTLRARRVSL